MSKTEAAVGEASLQQQSSTMVQVIDSSAEGLSKSQAIPDGQHGQCMLATLKTLLITVGAIIVVVVNSQTLYLQKFWNASGNFWHSAWNRLIDATVDDYYLLLVYGTTVVAFIVFWIAGAIYTMMDVTNRPVAMRGYKVQPGTNEPLDTKKLSKLTFVVLCNQLIVGYLLALAMAQLFLLRGCPPLRSIPTFQRLVADIICFILIEEIGFYYSHRLLHHKLFYRWTHKIHHEWTSPIAIEAIYCHPVEHILSNLLPALSGPLICGSHLITMWLWLSLVTLNTLNAHSGYHLPFMPSPESHDYHHLKFNQCYGVLGVLDWWHGTDTQFRKHRAFDRHITTTSLVPVREIYPD